MKTEYGKCLECGRRVKNRVYHKGLLIYICPRHLKGKKNKEVIKYLDELLKYEGKTSGKLYEDILKNLSILDIKISMLYDKIDSWMKIINQKRLDEYNVNKNLERILLKIDSLIQTVNKVDANNNELSFLNNLLRKYNELHYRIEDGIIIIYLNNNLEPRKFKELNKKLKNKGYTYDHKTYKWIKSIFS